MKKLTEADLEKGMKALTEAATKNNTAARSAELFAKAQNGTITDDERDELVKSLNGAGLVEKSTAGMRSDQIQKSLDVSDFLRDMTGGITSGLATLSEHIQKSQSDDHGFRVALATTLSAMSDVIREQGEIIKSMSERMGVVPARGPKSQGVRGVQPMAKSFAGTPPQGGANVTGGDLSKSQILDAMDGMIQKGIVAASNGEDLVKASTKYESLDAISPAVLADVQKYLASNPG